MSHAAAGAAEGASHSVHGDERFSPYCLERPFYTSSEFPYLGKDGKEVGESSLSFHYDQQAGRGLVCLSEEEEKEEEEKRGGDDGLQRERKGNP